MTWHADQIQGRPVDAAREKLLKQREALVFDIEMLKMAPMGKSQAAILGRQTDLIALAKKVKIIDKKLGRLV